MRIYLAYEIKGTTTQQQQKISDFRSFRLLHQNRALRTFSNKNINFYSIVVCTTNIEILSFNWFFAVNKNRRISVKSLDVVTTEVIIALQQ